MFCSNCGRKLADGSRFCSFCGARIVEAVPREDDFAQNPSPEANDQSAASWEYATGRVLLEVEAVWNLFKYANGRAFGGTMADGTRISVCDNRLVLHAKNSGSAAYNYFGLVGVGIRRMKAKKNPEIVFPYDQIVKIYTIDHEATKNHVLTWIVIELRSGDGMLVTPGRKGKGFFLEDMGPEVRNIVNVVRSHMN